MNNSPNQVNKDYFSKAKKVCPILSKHCTDCNQIGKYLECPLTVKDRIYAEIKEGGYEGVEPYALFRAVRKK